MIFGIPTTVIASIVAITFVITLVLMMTLTFKESRYSSELMSELTDLHSLYLEKRPLNKEELARHYSSPHSKKIYKTGLTVGTIISIVSFIIQAYEFVIIMGLPLIVWGVIKYSRIETNKNALDNTDYYYIKTKVIQLYTTRSDDTTYYYVKTDKFPHAFLVTRDFYKFLSLFDGLYVAVVGGTRYVYPELVYELTEPEKLI